MAAVPLLICSSLLFSAHLLLFWNGRSGFGFVLIFALVKGDSWHYPISALSFYSHR
jgi:hypothetical protein